MTKIEAARALVSRLADEIAVIEREMNVLMNAARAGRAYDADWYRGLSIQHTKAYRSLRGAKGAVTRLMNQGVEG